MRATLISLMFLLVASPAWAEAWVLICPPIEWTNNQPTLKATAPISEWEQIRAYDSASGCEAGREPVISKGDSERMKRFEKESSLICRCMPYALWWQTQQLKR